MVRKYDLLAISLLVFSAVVVIAITMDPKGFSLSLWQPLMAAVIALGGAGIVYRGTMLAYRAAMAKVDLDRSSALRADRRKALGIFLRLEFDLNVLAHRADLLLGLVQPQTKFDRAFDGSEIALAEPQALAEAWTFLDTFPPEIASSLAEIKGLLYDLENFSRVHNRWEVKAYVQAPKEFRTFRDTAAALAQLCETVRRKLRTYIDALHG